MKRYLLPLAVFLVMAGFLAVGLNRDPREVPSPLVDKPAPAFNLPRLDAPEQMISTQDLRGQVWLLNVWASWCVACRQEHPLLVDLARAGTVKVYGLNYKDKREDAIGMIDSLKGPVVLVGSSMGGWVAMLAARARPRGLAGHRDQRPKWRQIRKGTTRARPMVSGAP
jgi:cytochrome c biogenesis protein CcmG/thiol:disulfide interchange protein DsbE